LQSCQGEDAVQESKGGKFVTISTIYPQAALGMCQVLSLAVSVFDDQWLLFHDNDDDILPIRWPNNDL